MDLKNGVRPGPARNSRSIFITGFTRSGKTLLAKRLQDKLGYSLFKLDMIRQPHYSKPAIRDTYFSLLLRLYPNGLVVEGDNLSGENQSRPTIQSPETFAKTIESITKHNAALVFVGNADTTVEEKASAIIHYREHNPCWTSRAQYSLKQVRDLASRSIAYSRELRNMADSLGVPYIDIPTFDQTISRMIFRMV